jgi:hypothetical protein
MGSGLSGFDPKPILSIFNFLTVQPLLNFRGDCYNIPLRDYNNVVDIPPREYYDQR